MRGSTVILSNEGAVRIHAMGKDISEETVGRPTYLPGMLSAQAEDKASCVLYLSNAVFLDFEGPGRLEVERNELELREDNADLPIEEISGQSRTILNLRQGLLFVDSRTASSDSQLVVELPFGRVFGVDAVFYILVEYEQNNGVYDFTICCTEGNIRFVDSRKEVINAYAGQRIAGAGNYLTPSIEIGELTDASRELFMEHSERLARLSAIEIDREAMLEQMKAIPGSQLTGEGSTGQAATVDAGTKRPIIIEYSKPPNPITPFRGEIARDRQDSVDTL